MESFRIVSRNVLIVIIKLEDIHKDINKERIIVNVISFAITYLQIDQLTQSDKENVERLYLTLNVQYDIDNLRFAKIDILTVALLILNSDTSLNDFLYEKRNKKTN